MAKFNERLKLLRRESGLSQQDLQSNSELLKVASICMSVEKENPV